MKKIEAIIKPFKLDEVKDALQDAGITGITVTEVRGYGRQRGNQSNFKGVDYIVDFLPKIKLEIIVSDPQLDMAVETIKNTANSGHIGDGKIFVYNVEKVVRIRTGEEDEEAL